MKKKKIDSGRIQQKLQTRAEIINAVRYLMQKDEKITLEDVVKKTHFSRATVYRYFASIEMLVAEASLDFFHKSSDQLLKEIQTLPLSERILNLQNYYTRLARENEIVFRRYLGAVLTASVTSKEKLRGARRAKSFRMALEPYKNKLSEEVLNNLINIASVLSGIDSLIVCKDVCDLTGEEAESTLQWGMEMILKGIARKDI
jgi:AcrR family transcriptional regulator